MKYYRVLLVCPNLRASLNGRAEIAGDSIDGFHALRFVSGNDENSAVSRAIRLVIEETKKKYEWGSYLGNNNFSVEEIEKASFVDYVFNRNISGFTYYLQEFE